MILGVGVDTVTVARIERSMDNPHFAARIFTPAERDYLATRAPESAAARWAGKEAVAKALGGGIALCPPDGVEILPDALGQPQVTLSGAALARAKTLGVTRVHISLTHEGGMATAFAVAEGEAPCT